MKTYIQVKKSDNNIFKVYKSNKPILLSPSSDYEVHECVIQGDRGLIYEKFEIDRVENNIYYLNIVHDDNIKFDYLKEKLRVEKEKLLDKSNVMYIRKVKNNFSIPLSVQLETNRLYNELDEIESATGLNDLKKFLN